MPPAYIVVIDGSLTRNDGKPVNMRLDAQSLGLQIRATLGAANVFVTPETPTVQLAGGGILIGDLYSRNGTLIHDGGQLASAPSQATALRRHIREQCWGDYVLLLPGDEDPASISMTRSPSPACELHCFYALRDGRGFVTSDVTLASRIGLHEARLDYDYIAHYLTYPGLKTIRTGLREVSELLPGSTLQLVGRDIEVTQDWCPWDFSSAGVRYRDHDEAAASIRTALDMVVHTLANQDESILLELSGGLDSSIVGASLRGARSMVTCSTLTTSVPGGDEREYATLVADMLGVELMSTELGFEDAKFEFPLPPQLLTPAIGPLQYAIDGIMAANAERHDATSYFSGAGGDTVFSYLTNAAPAADAFRGAGLRAGFRAIHDISQFHQCTYWKAGRLTLRKLLRSNATLYEIDRTLIAANAAFPKPELHPWLSAPADALIGDRQRIFELSATQMYRDSFTRGLERRLRMPLLSQPVVEACLRTPSWMWFSGGQNRAVARRAYADALPPQILARKSKGSFTAYLGALFKRRKGAILKFLLDGHLQAHGILDADALRQVCRHQTSRDPMIRMFQLCALENWIRQQSSMPSPRV